MARPIEFDKTVALEKAMDVFWEKGFQATSLQDLISSMGLSKSSFYQAFKSKHELFAATLDYYTDRMVSSMSDTIGSTASGFEFIEQIFTEIVEQAPLKSSQKGCFLMNTASEFAQSNSQIAGLTKSGMKKVELVFIGAIKQSQNIGEISLDKSAETLANFLICNMSGLKTMVKAGIKRDTLRPIVTTIIESLK